MLYRIVRRPLLTAASRTPPSLTLDAPTSRTSAEICASGGSSASVTLVISGEPGSASIVYLPGWGSWRPTTVAFSSSERRNLTALIPPTPASSGLSCTWPSGVVTRTRGAPSAPSMVTARPGSPGLIRTLCGLPAPPA